VGLTKSGSIWQNTLIKDDRGKEMGAMIITPIKTSKIPKKVDGADC